ncbi:MAG: PorT family protein [Crocinitomicaceae bacterium]|nr:PorT family protein [Crocinitomicaceae bacterium]
MKKKIFFFFLLLYPLFSLAQKQFQAGLTAGLVTSQMSGDGLAGWNKFGFAGGGWVRSSLSSHLTGSMSIQFINKGSQTKIDTITYNSFAYKLNYIEVPVGLGYKMKERWIFSLGASAAFLISQKSVSNKYSYPTNPPFEKYDIGAFGSAVLLMGDYWSLELKLSTSFIPIRPSPNYANQFSFYERGNYNQVIQFMLMRGF